MKPPLIQKISLTHVLSFGECTTVDLAPLNVFIGPNGSGKSNFIDAIALMRASSFDPDSQRDMRTIVSRSGGVNEWVWKGMEDIRACCAFQIFNNFHADPIRHELFFEASSNHFVVFDELISSANDQLYSFFYGHPSITYRDGGELKIRHLNPSPTASVVSEILDPAVYPEIAWLNTVYRNIRIYKEWSFGKLSILRQDQRADGRADVLEEDYSNFALYLSHLCNSPKTKRLILTRLRELYSDISDITFQFYGSRLQFSLVEGEFSISSARLSDGTLRFLMLIALLSDPDPYPLVCIEEPELGLHPDILPMLASLLVEASERTQLIVTTHSDILIDALSETPESIVVCEKEDGQTTMRRLNADEMKPWLEEYRLGRLWMMGQLGGTRW